MFISQNRLVYKKDSAENQIAAITTHLEKGAESVPPEMAEIVEQSFQAGNITDEQRTQLLQTMGGAKRMHDKARLANLDPRNWLNVLREGQVGRLLQKEVAAIAAELPPRLSRLEGDPEAQLRAIRDVAKTVGVENLPFLEKMLLSWSKKEKAGKLYVSTLTKLIETACGGFVRILKEDKGQTSDEQIRRLVRDVNKEEEKTGIGSEINWVVEASLDDEESKVHMKRAKTMIESGLKQLAFKASAAVPFISALDPEGSKKRLKDQIAQLFQWANDNPLPNGDTCEITIDSENYEILDILREATMEAGRDFPKVRYNVVVQYYLNDAEDRMFKPIVEESIKRVKAGGVPIGIRFVAGANLDGESARAAVDGVRLPILDGRPMTMANGMRILNQAVDPIAEGNLRAVFASNNVITHNKHLVILKKILQKRSVYGKNGLPPNAVRWAILKGMMPSPLLKMFKQFLISVHKYETVITREDIYKFYDYYCRRIGELAGQSKGLQNFKGQHAKHGFSGPMLRDQAKAEVLAMETFNNLGLDEHGLTPMDFTNRGPGHDKTQIPFSRAQYTPMAAMDATSDKVKEWAVARGQSVKEMINGPTRHIALDPRFGAATETRKVTSPANRENPFLNVELAGKAYIDAVFKAPCTFGTMDFEQRFGILGDLVEGLPSIRDEVVEARMASSALTLPQADANFNEGVDFSVLSMLDVEALLLRTNLQLVPNNGEYPESVLVIGPKNFTFAIMLADTINALAMGQKVVLKPPFGVGEEAVLAMKEFVDYAHKCGVPEDSLILLLCDNDMAGYACTKADHLRFTGGTSTAMKIHKANPNKDLIAETGGHRNIAIVDKTADPRLVGAGNTWATARLGGQKCSKPGIEVLCEGVNTETHFRYSQSVVGQMRVADSTDPAADITHLTKVLKPGDDLYEAIVNLRPGEEWLMLPKELEGHPDSTPENLIANRPDRIDRLSPGIRIMRVKSKEELEAVLSKFKEIFGPIRTVIVYDGPAKDVIDAANKVGGVLTAGLFSTDEETIEYYDQNMRSGQRYVGRTQDGAAGHEAFGNGTRSTTDVDTDTHRGMPGACTGTMARLIANAGDRLQARKTINARYVKEEIPDDSKLKMLLVYLEANFPADHKFQEAIKAGWSYAYEQATHFSKTRPTSYQAVTRDGALVVDNYTRSIPLGSVVLRVQKTSYDLDILKSIFAIVASGNKLRISVDPEAGEILRPLLSSLNINISDLFMGDLEIVFDEDDDAFNELVRNSRQNGTGMVRYAPGSDIPKVLSEAAIQANCHIDNRVMRGDGQVDMIPLFREETTNARLDRLGMTQYRELQRERAATKQALVLASA